MQLRNFEQAAEEGAIDQLERLIGQAYEKRQYDLLYDAADLLMECGYLQQTDSIYELLLSVMPDAAQLKIDRANTLLELGREDDALLYLMEISPDDEEYVQSLIVLSDYYQMTGMAEVALEKVREALRLAPHEPIIRFAYAELLLGTGRYAEAASYYEGLQKEGYESVGMISMNERLSETYSAGGAFEEALSYYEALLQDRQSPDTLFGAAYAYYQADQPNRAIVLLDTLIEADPDYFSAYMLAGQAAARLNDDEKAYNYFKAGIVRDEFDKELRLSAGKSALKLQKKKEAEDHLLHSLALDPEYTEALIVLASLYNEEERDEELIALLSTEEARQTDSPLLYSFLAFAQERKEQFEDAYVSYSKAYVNMKDDTPFVDRFIRFLLEEGKRGEAIEVIKELLQREPHEEWSTFLDMLNDEEV